MPFGRPGDRRRPSRVDPHGQRDRTRGNVAGTARCGLHVVVRGTLTCCVKSRESNGQRHVIPLCRVVRAIAPLAPGPTPFVEMVSARRGPSSGASDLLADRLLVAPRPPRGRLRGLDLARGGSDLPSGRPGPSPGCLGGAFEQASTLDRGAPTCSRDPRHLVLGPPEGPKTRSGPSREGSDLPPERSGRCFWALGGALGKVARLRARGPSPQGRVRTFWKVRTFATTARSA